MRNLTPAPACTCSTCPPTSPGQCRTSPTPGRHAMHADLGLPLVTERCCVVCSNLGPDKTVITRLSYPPAVVACPRACICPGWQVLDLRRTQQTIKAQSTRHRWPLQLAEHTGSQRLIGAVQLRDEEHAERGDQVPKAHQPPVLCRVACARSGHMRVVVPNAAVLPVVTTKPAEPLVAQHALHAIAQHKVGKGCPLDDRPALQASPHGLRPSSTGSGNPLASPPSPEIRTAGQGAMASDTPSTRCVRTLRNHSVFHRCCARSPPRLFAATRSGRRPAQHILHAQLPNASTHALLAQLLPRRQQH
eukprot:3442395-Rhodomonas_salina.3